MDRWTIFYAGGTQAGGTQIGGASLAEWIAAPATGVQVVVVHAPPPEPRPDREGTGYVGLARRDKTFYTGIDAYDPLGTGAPKAGSEIARAAYDAIWEQACAGG